MDTKDFGFIILRCVKKDFPQSIKCWIECYKRIRLQYPENKIVIIDDNSDSDIVDIEFQSSLTNTIIIQSEYPAGKGELLPYIYYSREKFFHTACIIHDSVFLNKKFDEGIIENIKDYAILWSFEAKTDNIEYELKLIKELDNNDELVKFYSARKWIGCFGGMSVINYDYLKELDNKYNLSKLINHINTRTQRMSFERVISVILEIKYPNKCINGILWVDQKYRPGYNNKTSMNRIELRDRYFTKLWVSR